MNAKERSAMRQKQNLTEREVSEIYRIGTRQLRLMRLRGKGPRFLKVSGQLGHSGGRILYPVADLEAWLASRPSGGERVAVWPPKMETR
jgi:hypothetical protein